MKVSDTLVMMPNNEFQNLSSSPGKDEFLSAQSHISRLADEIQEDEDSIERFNKVISNIDSCTDPKKKKILEKSRPEYNSKIKKVQIRLEHKYAEMKRWEEQLVEFNNEQEAIELETQANKAKK
jgi:chromosome segregation ATPase